MTTINKNSFGPYADQVEEFGGEYTLPISECYEIHPAATEGRWAVVNVKTGQVNSEFDSIDDAVEMAEELSE